MSKVFINMLESSYRSGELPKLVSQSLCLVSVTKALGYSTHGRYTKMLKDFCISSGIDISHFTLNGLPPTQLLEKSCPQCNKIFSYKSSDSKETCSHACANIYFVYKQGAKNRKDGSTTYVDTLNKYYSSNMLKIKCCVCEESRVLDVHHVDEDRANNDVTNLVFLCPNHHAIYHRFGDQEVIEAIVTELDNRPLVK